jgi:hypothetical protein
MILKVLEMIRPEDKIFAILEIFAFLKVTSGIAMGI